MQIAAVLEGRSERICIFLATLKIKSKQWAGRAASFIKITNIFEMECLQGTAVFQDHDEGSIFFSANPLTSNI